jgi:hypothetical protein
MIDLRNRARQRRWQRAIAITVSLGLALATGACASSAASAAASTTARASAAAVPRTDAAGTVWLCRPGIADDPCGGSLAATVINAKGHRTGNTTGVSKNSASYDCFYLYPTNSLESTTNSDLTVQTSEEQIAMAQAERFSTVCNVWAPMYRSITVRGLGAANSTDPGAYDVAYDSVLADWNDFIAHYDGGHPIMFIGHSQGSVMLIKLLEAQIDPSPALRHLMLGAIIAGGNVTVPTGKTVGATFKNIPICGATQKTHCVIAYSSFPSEPPSNANFGRPGQGISLNTGQTATTGVQIACVNPAAVGGGTADLLTYFPVEAVPPIPSMAPPAPTVRTPWLEYPNQYAATCENAEGATWLQVTNLPQKTGVRPYVHEIAGPTWGYHFQDINLTLGNLVQDVHNAEASYKA